jgi:predicted trehalose synthase
MGTATILSAVSSFAVVAALIFAALQVRVANRTRAEHAAISIVEAAQSEAWTRGLNQLHRIPAEATAEQIDALGSEVTSAIEQVGIRVETIGYMVWRGMVDIAMVDDLFGGIVIFWWSRIKPFAERDRMRTSNPKSYEWFQWLAERLVERRQRRPAIPAYLRTRAHPLNVNYGSFGSNPVAATLGGKRTL